MIVNRLIARSLQRYWRHARGLRLEARALVRSAGGEVLLVREDAGAPWRLPGGRVERGESAEGALERHLAAAASLEVLGPFRLFAVYADNRVSQTCHIALFEVPYWRHAGPRNSTTVNLFSVGDLPETAEREAMERIGDVVAGRQRSEMW